MDEVIIQNTDLKDQFLHAEDKASKAEEEAKALNQLNKDLGAQVQHFLWMKYNAEHGSAIGGRSRNIGGTGNDVITDHLVTFDSIEDMHNKYAQLLKVTRKLTEDMEGLESQSFGGAMTMKSSLDAANRELESLREARVRTEEMVLGLVQQRDMYRTMVDEMEKSGHSSDHKRITAGSPPTSRIVSTKESVTPHHYHDLQARITDLNEDNVRLKERGSRMEDQLSALNEMLDKAKVELTALRKEAAYSASESKYQSEKASRLEESFNIAQQTIETSNARRSEVEVLYATQQREIRLLNEKLHQISNEKRLLEDAAQRLQVNIEVSRASERRLETQLKDLRDEIGRQGSLMESMRKIEAGLASRTEDEKNSLLIERDSLVKTVENLRKEAQNSSLFYDQKIRSLEEESRLTRLKLDEKSLECTTAREDLLREQGLSRAAQERGNVLEQQLIMTQERLGTIQGSNTFDLVAVADVAQKEAALSKALSDVENLRCQLSAAEQHVEDYKIISASTEKVLQELREKSSGIRKELEEQLESVKLEFAKYKEDHDGSGMLNLVLELEQTREKLSGSEKENSESTLRLQNEVEIAKAAASQAASQMDNLHKDALKYQQAARSANANYERELQLHAHDAAELRNTEIELDKARAELEAASQRLTDISADAALKEKAFENERTQKAIEIDELKESIASLRRINDVFESQIESFTAKLNKSDTTFSKSTNSEADSSISEDGNGTQQVLDLHEALRSCKRERDTLELKLAHSEAEKARIQGFLMSTERQLAETRGELKKELERKSALHDESSYAKLMAEVTQVNLLRDSNAHLSAENKLLIKSKIELEKSLTDLKIVIAPLEDQIKNLQAEIISLNREVTSCSEDASYWKNRVHELFSKYGEVNPGEHQETLGRCEALLLERDQANSEYQILKESMTKLEEELASTKTAVETGSKSAANLREKCRFFMNRKNELESQVTSLQETIATLTKEKEDAIAGTTELKSKYDKLIAMHNRRTASAAATASLAASTGPSTAVSTSTSSTSNILAISSATTAVAPVTSTSEVSSVEKISGSTDGPSQVTSEKEKELNLRKKLLEDRKMRKESAQKVASEVPVAPSREASVAATADVSAQAVSGTTSNPGTEAASVKKCKFFMNGNCRNGATCQFAHDEVSVSETSINSVTTMEVSQPPPLVEVEQFKPGSASPSTSFVSLGAASKVGSASPAFSATASAFVPGALKRSNSVLSESSGSVVCFTENPLV